jgi:hypothetical protein
MAYTEKQYNDYFAQSDVNNPAARAEFERRYAGVGTSAYVNPFAAGIGVNGAPINPYKGTPTATVPTPVISSAPATNLINTQIKSTTESANTAITTKQQQDQAAAAAEVGKQFGGTPTTPAKTDGTTSLSPADQAAQDIANTPPDGHRWVYSANGSRSSIPTGDATPTGMYDVKPSVNKFTSPTSGTPVETIPKDNGTQIGKMSDGTYALFDGEGNFLGNTNEFDYSNTKATGQAYAGQQAQKNADHYKEQMDQVINGTYPLTPDQKAQIEAVKQTFQRLINEQTLANQNYQGGVATAQGLLGMTEYSPTLAMGTLKGAIDSGLTKIADLNNKLLQTVSQMNSAFRTENFEMLNTAYKNYQDYADKKQAELDKITAATAAHEKDVRDFNADQAYKKATLAMENDKFSYQQKKDVIDQALSEGRLSEEHRHNLETERAAMAKVVADAGPGFDPNTPFASTITSTARNVGRLDRASFVQQVSDSAKRGDWKTMATDMRTAVEQGMTAEEKNKLTKHQEAISELNYVENLLRQYEKAGGQTGWLVGNAQGVATRFGQLVTDPKLTEIQSQLSQAFVRFRADVTGAAFSEAESKGYEALLPMANKTFELNMPVIAGARGFAQQQVDSTYGRKMGVEGYNNLKSLVSQQDAQERIMGYLPTADATTQAQVVKMLENGDSPEAVAEYFNI